MIKLVAADTYSRGRWNPFIFSEEGKKARVERYDLN